MTISTSASVVTYVGNGSTTNFPFSFVGVSATDIEVIFTDTTGAQTTLNPTTYTLVLTPAAPGELWGIGGTVTYPNVGSPIALNTQLSIIRIVPYTQDVSISNQGAFYPQAIEQGLDLLELQLQQTNTDVTYAIKTPITDPTPPGTLPPAAERANLYLGFDSLGNPAVLNGTGNSGGGSVSSVALSAPAEFVVSGSPITTTGTLTITKATESPNVVYAGPTSGGVSQPTFRALVAADLPLATSSTFGAVKPDNTSVSISGGVLSVASGQAANPTATAGPTAVNGTSTKFMRADAAPAVQLGSNSQKGIVQVDGTTITASSGVISATATVLGANPTAVAGPVATNGAATTYMRSDAAPAVQKGSASQFGIVQVDGTTITASGGVISGAASVSGANPTATAKDTAVNGVASTYMRSDAAPAIQLTTSSLFGLCKVDGTSITAAGGVISSAAASDPSIAPWLVVPASPGFDPAMFISSMGTLSNSNKTFTPASSSPYNYVFGTTARYTGKWYFEVVMGSTSFSALGITGVNGHLWDGGGTEADVFGREYANQIGWQPGGTVQTLGSPNFGFSAKTIGTAASWTSAQRLSIAVDLTNGFAWFRVTSGNWNNDGSANPSTPTGGFSIGSLFGQTPSKLVWPGLNSGTTSAQSLYLKTADFIQSVPSGFTSWSGL